MPSHFAGVKRWAVYLVAGQRWRVECAPFKWLGPTDLLRTRGYR